MAESKSYMTEQEYGLKKRLLKLLVDDGKGHHHLAYAKRLRDFDLRVVDENSSLANEIRVAAVSFDTMTVYINSIALHSAEDFEKLNVIIRHELAHVLMLHQIRMIAILASRGHNEKIVERIMHSPSMANIQNILMDYEIANTRYSAEDKEIVRNLILNGHELSGLVTEDSDTAWATMSLEEMYESLSQYANTDISSSYARRQVSATNKNLLSSLPYRGYTANKMDTIFGRLLPINLALTKTKAKDLKNNYKQIVLDIVKNRSNISTFDGIELDLLEIRNSNFFKPIKLSPDIKLYTPEEKRIAAETLIKLYQDANADKLVPEYIVSMLEKYIMQGQMTPDQIREIASKL